MEKAIDIGRMMEVSEAQLKTMTGDDAKIHGINPKYSRQRRDKSFESR